MQGYVPVDIPTKRYIAAYVKFKLGPMPFMRTDTTIGAKLYDLLQHETNERRTEFANERYNTQLRIYITRHAWINRGAYLNHTNIKNFNLFVEAELKDKYRTRMDDLIEMLPNFKANLPEVRRKIGIDFEAWDDDSIRKDYYRYRLAAGKPLLYDKNISPRTVPSDKLF